MKVGQNMRSKKADSVTAEPRTNDNHIVGRPRWRGNMQVAAARRVLLIPVEVEEDRKSEVDASGNQSM